jgi:hypothetical protein
MTEIKTGRLVKLKTPDNPRLHGSLAIVRLIESWGVHVDTPAAASGKYRALFSEIELVEEVHKVPVGGYIGDPCEECGQLTLRRNGSCLLCDSCGRTSGCS